MFKKVLFIFVLTILITPTLWAAAKLPRGVEQLSSCLLYTSDAADE